MSMATSGLRLAREDIEKVNSLLCVLPGGGDAAVARRWRSGLVTFFLAGVISASSASHMDGGTQGPAPGRRLRYCAAKATIWPRNFAMTPRVAGDRLAP